MLNKPSREEWMQEVQAIMQSDGNIIGKAKPKGHGVVYKTTPLEAEKAAIKAMLEDDPADWHDIDPT